LITNDAGTVRDFGLWQFLYYRGFITPIGEDTRDE
jgi:hypothetical protein